MKKIISLLCVLAISSFAQKGTEFQAFSGEFLKVGDMKAGYHPFTMPVQGEGWAFKAEGEVQAPAGDSYVLLDGILDGTVYAVVAYVPAVAAGTDAKDYQVGMFDMMIYLEDESVKVRNVKFTLLPPANDEWASDMARDANEIGAASKATLWSGANDVAITRTSAVPLTKKDLQPPPPKPVVRNLPPPPAEEVAPAPEEEAPVVKKKRVVKKKKVVAEPEEEEEEAPAPKKKKRVVKKKKVVEPEEEEVEPAPKKKKRVVKKKVIKKKRVVVEEEPEEEEEELTIREKRRRAAAKRQKAAQNSDYE